MFFKSKSNPTAESPFKNLLQFIFYFILLKTTSSSSISLISFLFLFTCTQSPTVAITQRRQQLRPPPRLAPHWSYTRTDVYTAIVPSCPVSPLVTKPRGEERREATTRLMFHPKHRQLLLSRQPPLVQSFVILFIVATKLLGHGQQLTMPRKKEKQQPLLSCGKWPASLTRHTTRVPSRLLSLSPLNFMRNPDRDSVFSQLIGSPENETHHE